VTCHNTDDSSQFNFDISCFWIRKVKRFGKKYLTYISGWSSDKLDNSRLWYICYSVHWEWSLTNFHCLQTKFIKRGKSYFRGSVSLKNSLSIRLPPELLTNAAAQMFLHTARHITSSNIYTFDHPVFDWGIYGPWGRVLIRHKVTKA
jgi:hypothetical protein